jgi:hypothetical protein
MANHSREPVNPHMMIIQHLQPSQLALECRRLTQATTAEGDPTVQKLPAAKLKLSGAANSQLEKVRAIHSSTRGPVQPGH